MNKPYVIIHTHTAIDGNIDVMDLQEFEEASRQYQELYKRGNHHSPLGCEARGNA